MPLPLKSVVDIHFKLFHFFSKLTTSAISSKIKDIGKCLTDVKTQTEHGIDHKCILPLIAT